jgi:hypothetical protein
MKEPFVKNARYYLKIELFNTKKFVIFRQIFVGHLGI